MSTTATMDSPTHVKHKRQPIFATTHWSVVLTAGRSDTTRAQEALAKLCESYWYPLYAYVRRRGYASHDAQDLTQAFFARLLERHAFANVDPELGRFRSFLLASMNHFLAGEWKSARAKKRGGDFHLLSLDLATAEERYDLEPADNSTPDKLFEKQWALALLNQVLNKLENEFLREGKSELFAALKQTLAGSRESQPYEKLATELKMNENALKTAVHRLRKRYRELIRAEIANTVASPDEVAGEMNHLLGILAGK